MYNEIPEMSCTDEIIAMQLIIINQYLNKSMKKRKIVLASKSPRRRELLKQIGITDFEIRESEYKEDMQAKSDPIELVKFLALEKAKDVAKHYDDAIIIAGDTFTIFAGKFIGKPKDENDAKKILRNFSGQEHGIVSGLAIIDTKSGQTILDCGEAKVKFKKLTEEEIDDYLAMGESLGVAGAYGLMSRAAPLIEGVCGDFYSVIGLPLNKLYLNLKKIGINIYRLK